MKSTLSGIVRGKLIELEQEPGLPDGQAVRVTLEPVSAREEGLPPGEGIRRSVGGWSDDPEGLEQYLEWNRQERQIDRREIER